MPLDPETRRQLSARMEYYRDLGIYDLYRRAVAIPPEPAVQTTQAASIETTPARETSPLTMSKKIESLDLPIFSLDPSSDAGQLAAIDVENRPAALKAIREVIGDCTRCKLHKQGRKQIVFGVGNTNADLMFVGEAPGADEDQQGEPFVGRAGQLLNNMITAMGLRREDVYIANVIKCRPPGNRTPEREECETCAPFLMRQIDVIKPKVIVALGAVAAKNLLGLNDSMANLRGRFYDFRGTQLAVTYHPAFLLRDPRQKKEAWKDLQMVMQTMGLAVRKSKPE
ncbi:MAG TPA: uracil-DNA glycosylase [Terriglobales bacterium]|nr:uracil-DNA glycosylase [Terriglobales bacterium]